MSKDELKGIVSEVTEECHVSLKILALKKRTTLALYVRDVLEKHITSKSKLVGTSEEV